MITPISHLPSAVYERLLKIQRNPGQYEGYFSPEGGKGCAIFGIIVTLLGLTGAAMTASQGDDMPIVAWIVLAALVLWIGFASISHIRRYNRAELRPFFFVNPLYLIRVSLDEVTHYELITELADFKRTDHYTNGIYQKSEFKFTFQGGFQETLDITPLTRADEFSNTLKAFAEGVSQAVKDESYANLVDCDILKEIADQKEKGVPSQLNSRIPGLPGKLPSFTMALILGALLGTGFHYANQYTYQQRRLQICRIPQDYERFFKKFESPNFFAKEAQQGLFEARKKEVERYKNSATKLRKLIAQKEFPHLTKDQGAEIAKIYQTSGTKALANLYDKAIAKYQKSTAEANKQADKALKKRMEQLGKYRRYSQNWKVFLLAVDKMQTREALEPKFQKVLETYQKTVKGANPLATQTIIANKKSMNFYFGIASKVTIKDIKNALKNMISKIRGKVYDSMMSQANKLEKVDPKALTAVITILKNARDKGNYDVIIQYSRSVSVKNEKQLIKKLVKKNGIKLAPMSPLFTEKHNIQRESTITSKIQKAYGEIIPQEILNFSQKGKIVFHISYTVMPSGETYYLRKQEHNKNRTDFMGILFIWKFTISLDGKEIYHFSETSEPPASFNLGRSKGSVTDIMYNRMAETAFDAFGSKILKRFGIYKQPPPYIPYKPLNFKKKYLPRRK